jgi:hypothetical protein
MLTAPGRIGVKSRVVRVLVSESRSATPPAYGRLVRTSERYSPMTF